jgi:hypothetical protein
VESLIYVNTETVTAHCTPTGNGPPRVICTLLAQWQARFSFFVTGEDPAAVAGITLRCVLKEVPTGAVLLASTTATLSAAVYTFDFASVDSSGLRTLIGDADEIELQGEIEWTLSGRVERVYFPVTVLNSRHRPDDGAPDPADSASNAWLSARAVRFDEAQTLTTEQKAQARTNIGVTSGVSDHGALTGLADDDHTQYFNQPRGDARYPLASTMTTALAGKEPLQTLATQAEMEAGTVTDPRRMSPKLVADAIAALSSGGSGIDLPVSIDDGGTGVTTAQAARVALGVEEVIAATAQEVAISFSTSEPDAPWGGANFDLSTTTQTVRVWFDDGIEPAPDAPVGGRLIGVGYIGDAYMQADALAAALESDAAFTATLSGASVTVTNVTAGLCVAAYVPPSNAYISGNLNTAGANAYQRLSPLNGQELQNIDAVTLDGNPPSFFAPASHQHAFSSLLTRPRFAATTSDSTSSSTALANLLTVSVPSAGAWTFFATGFSSGSLGSEGLTLAINGPAASAINGNISISTNAAGSLTNGVVTAWDSKVIAVLSPAAPSLGRWTVSGRFVATAAGTFAIRYAAEIGGANSVTIQAGAVLQLMPVG